MSTIKEGDWQIASVDFDAAKARKNIHIAQAHLDPTLQGQTIHAVLAGLAERTMQIIADKFARVDGVTRSSK